MPSKQVTFVIVFVYVFVFVFVYVFVFVFVFEAALEELCPHQGQNFCAEQHQILKFRSETKMLE